MEKSDRGSSHFRHGLDPRLSEPTRVIKDSRTLIDHFYTTNPDNIISNGISTISISDHYLIYGIRKFKVSKENAKIIKYRDYKHFNEQMFLQDLQNSLYDFGRTNTIQIYLGRFGRINSSESGINMLQ